MLYVVIGSDTFRIGGRIGKRGEGGTTEAVLTALVGGTLAFAVTGKSAIMPAGTLVSGYLDREATVIAP